MSVTLTTNMEMGKPTVGNSYNVWGNELNEQAIDILDAAVLSNNFAENAASHSGLNFYYKNGRILDNITLRSVAAGSVVLTDATTNYIEVSTAGVVSANIVGFTEGSIPLFQVITAAGAISSVTDKRSYLTPSWAHLFSLAGNVISSTKNLKVGAGTLKDWDSTYNYIQVGGNNAIAYTGAEGAGSKFFIANNAYYDDTDARWEYISTDEASMIIMEDGAIKLKTAISGAADNPITFNDVLVVDKLKNSLFNGAAAQAVAEGTLSLKQGVNPTTPANADQISIFASSGANSTIGFITEQAISNDMIRVLWNDEERYLHLRESTLNPLTAFMTSTVTIVNDTAETTVLTFTLPGRAAPQGQMIHIQLHGQVTTASAAHQNTVRFKVGGDTTSIVTNTGSTLTSSHFWMNFYCYVKSTTAYCMAGRAYFGGNTYSIAYDQSDTFTSDVTISVTSQWNIANAGTTISFYGGVAKIYN